MAHENEHNQIEQLHDILISLLHSDHYVPYSEYSDIIPTYKDTISYFNVLKDSDMLHAYCSNNSLNESDVLFTLDVYGTLQSSIDAANDAYIESRMLAEKDYLDSILNAVDPAISLDDDQRKVILTDEDNCLVIAGAGAGKTTTIAAKVKYLVEKKSINPADILIISFTNKAVDELKARIQKSLKIPCPIATFHSVGNHILHVNDQPKKVAPDSKIYFVLSDYFKNSVIKNESLVNNLILFFSSYFEPAFEGSSLNDFFNNASKKTYTTMRSDLDEISHEIIDTKTKRRTTVRNEVMRSTQEVEIANYLYLNNLEYTYEPVYPFNIMLSRKPYTPDFLIQQGDKVVYLEHFGISEDGRNSLYTQEQLEIYKDAIDDKIRLHRDHGTDLIYTFSSYNDRRSITEHLEELLISRGFQLNRKSNSEIIGKLVSSEDSRYFRRLVMLICRFITNFKANGFSLDEFDRMYHSTQNVRSRLFLNICQECYLEYMRYLNENDAIDFEDMINESARIIREVKEMKEKLHYKYIIVDEYQDISRQRFDLTTALSEICDGKIIAVGDDWQSIYGFSGSDISLFTKFEEKMGYAKMLRIVHTYRNSQDIIDIAGNFIQKNPSQIKKDLISPKRIKDPVIIYTYDTTPKKPDQNRRTGALFAQAYAVQTALDKIVNYSILAGQDNPGTILMLGRFNFEAEHLERTGLFEYRNHGSRLISVKYPKLKISFMTVHSSKGLGYDNVIILNGKNETYGFPSKIEDDPVLGFVIKGDRSIDYAEERRLFYVAMTRTKNRVYCVAPKQNPSEFLLEIKHDYKNVILVDDWNESYQRISKRKSCPICGFPMQYRYKENYGLKLFLCTNAPEVCGFMTNDYSAGRMGIMKCNHCRDGYLIVKKSGNGNYFLGCTNYTKDKRGCNNTISVDDYYEMMHYEPHPRIEESEYDYQPVEEITTKKPIEEPKVEIQEIAPHEALVFPKREQKEARLDTIIYKEYKLNDVLKNTLLCLNHISEKKFYGLITLIATLHGDPEIAKINRGLEFISEYGIYSTWDYDDLRAVIQWMIDNRFLYKTREYRPKLHPTFEGNNYLDTITKPKLEKLKAYLEDPTREKFNYEEDLK